VKRFLLSMLHVSFISVTVCPQEIPLQTEQELENLAELQESETEDDSFLQQMEYYQKQRLNLNTADEYELREFGLLTDLQIQNLVSYRRLFGKLADIYELQAVPTMDIQTIRRILPFVSIQDPVDLNEYFLKKLSGGDHILLLRVSRVLEKQKGFDKSLTGSRYLGSPQKFFFRYRYSYKNQLQYGLVGDKDAGEQFFNGAQSKGFDFYSFHVFARKLGRLEAFALGDYTVNLGQGLIQWQSMAFRKSANVMNVKRQSPVLKPYNSAGEYNFHRGIAFTWRKERVEVTGFLSLRKISANFSLDSSAELKVSSFQMSGNHRTATEVEDRNRLGYLAFGGRVRYSGQGWHLAINAVHHQFSAPIEKRDEPYNLFAIKGNNWSNLSADYSYTFRNLHFFGETAFDKNQNKASLNGILLSVDSRVDVSMVYRAISKKYQAHNAAAFTEGTYPTNEYGLFTGLTVRPTSALRFDFYSDFFRFPWLRFQADAPGRGREYIFQVTYTPRRHIEVYSRYRSEIKESNDPSKKDVFRTLRNVPRQNWRIHAGYKVSNAVSLRHRVELAWFDRNSSSSESGFLINADIIYKPLMKPVSFSGRIQYFETSGYNARLYAYENDVLYGYSIPVFSDCGFRYYLLINYDLSRKLSCWVRLARTVYADLDTIGSALDEIRGHHKTELKMQMRYMF